MMPRCLRPISEQATKKRDGRSNMMKMLALAAATACALAAPGPANAADPVKIGVALSQTGNLADSAGPYFKGLDLWREQVNARGGLGGHPIEFVVYDDRSDPGTAARRWRRSTRP